MRNSTTQGEWQGIHEFSDGWTIDVIQNIYAQSTSTTSTTTPCSSFNRICHQSIWHILSLGSLCIHWYQIVKYYLDVQPNNFVLSTKICDSKGSQIQNDTFITWSWSHFSIPNQLLPHLVHLLKKSWSHAELKSIRRIRPSAGSVIDRLEFYKRQQLKKVTFWTTSVPIVVFAKSRKVEQPSHKENHIWLLISQHGPRKKATLSNVYAERLKWKLPGHDEVKSFTRLACELWN